MRECQNCGAEVYAKGRCRLCYVYWRKHGTERPEHIWLRHNQRQLERELAYRAWGPVYGLVQ